MYDLMRDKRDLEPAVRGWIWFRECGISEDGWLMMNLQKILSIPPSFSFLLLTSAYYPNLYSARR